MSGVNNGALLRELTQLRKDLVDFMKEMRGFMSMVLDPTTGSISRAEADLKIQRVNDRVDDMDNKIDSRVANSFRLAIAVAGVTAAAFSTILALLFHGAGAR